MRKQLLVVDSTTSHNMMSDETSQVLRACLRVIGPARLHQVHVVQYSLVQPLHLLPAAESRGDSSWCSSVTHHDTSWMWSLG